MHTATQFTSALIVLLAMIFMHSNCEAHLRKLPLCRNRKSCEENCDDCDWGSSYAVECGFEECLKGPGDRCGGRNHMWGKCGDGLACQCNKCNGCSTTKVDRSCFNNTCALDTEFLPPLFHLDRPHRPTYIFEV
ncbi:neuroparsin-A-like [Neodiprion virginianus]|uniref:neuroparsin-A-like n=1 Tax=Neodiprion virginianus TaxID=2961670 RepID=UPI001EE70B81|nr:neuroparsin-A-like [Neodiprion virginianus]